MKQPSYLRYSSSILGQDNLTLRYGRSLPKLLKSDDVRFCENTQFDPGRQTRPNGLHNKMHIHPADLSNIAIPIPTGLSFRTDV